MKRRRGRAGGSSIGRWDDSGGTSRGFGGLRAVAGGCPKIRWRSLLLSSLRASTKNTPPAVRRRVPSGTIMPPCSSIRSVSSSSSRHLSTPRHSTTLLNWFSGCSALSLSVDAMRSTADSWASFTEILEVFIPVADTVSGRCAISLGSMRWPAASLLRTTRRRGSDPPVAVGGDADSMSLAGT